MITIETKGVNDLSRKFIKAPQKLSEATQKVVEMEARVLARDLAYNTLPYGKSYPKKFAERIEADVRALYASTGELPKYASQLYGILLDNDADLAPKFWAAVERGDDAAALRLLRRGRVPSSIDLQVYKSERLKRNKRIKGFAAPARIEALINRQRKTIGTAKAGWFQAQKSLGGRARGNSQMPDWVRKAGGKKAGFLGASVRNYRKDYHTVTLVNKVRYIDRALGQRGIDHAQTRSRLRLRKAIEKAWQYTNRTGRSARAA